MASPVKLNAFAGVFTVGDVAASLGFFLGRLGFREHFRLGDPPSYAIVERDAVSIHLMPASEMHDTRGRSTIYVVVTDVDRRPTELQDLGCPLAAPPAAVLHG